MICTHHYHLYHLSYTENAQTRYCVNPFGHHKKGITKCLNVITESEVEAINQMTQENKVVLALLGSKIWVNGWKKLNSSEDGVEEDITEMESDPDAFEMKVDETESLNSTLGSEIGCSPMKIQKLCGEKE